MSTYKSTWAPDRKLTNAKFEGYKLSFSDDEDAEDENESAGSAPTSWKGKRAIKLDASGVPPGRCLKGYSEARLGYKQARSRAKWNHLNPGRGKEAAWISGDGTFWMIDLEDVHAVPKCVITLPEPLETIASTSAAALTPEYPTAHHLRNSTWACSDGYGQLYIVDCLTARISSTYALLDNDSAAPIPFAFYSVDVAGSEASAIIARASPQDSAKRISDTFSVELVRFSLDSPELSTSPLENRALSRVVRLSGNDLPTYTTFLDGDCMIGSCATLSPSSEDSSKSSTISTGAVENPYVPAPEEIVGIPRQGQDAQDLLSNADLTTPPPYSWMQSSDSLTLVFALPSSVNAKDMKVVFRPGSISLLVSTQDTDTKIPLPHLDFAKLWDDIDASSSTWTWEKTGGTNGKYGVLAIYLEKKHEGTRWLHVFKEDNNATLQKDFFNVDETLDRSELLQITEAMEKFTADLSKTDATAAGQDSMNQRSSLLGEELDMELDAPGISDGRAIQFVRVTGIYSETPTVRRNENEEVAELISRPIPSSSSSSDKSIIVKHDIDGMLFEPQATVTGIEWLHTSTYPALAFVLASKRDVVHVYHHSHKFAIGLEAGNAYDTNEKIGTTSYSSIRSSKLNAYLYYPPPPGSKAKSAKQKVLSLSDSPIGAVLGAVYIDNVLLILCEKELVVLPI